MIEQYMDMGKIEESWMSWEKDVNELADTIVSEVVKILHERGEQLGDEYYLEVDIHPVDCVDDVIEKSLDALREKFINVLRRETGTR